MKKNLINAYHWMWYDFLFNTHLLWNPKIKSIEQNYVKRKKKKSWILWKSQRLVGKQQTTGLRPRNVTDTKCKCVPQFSFMSSWK